ncbi:MAG TPA: MBL fold metallo-hydrolase [Casimicrobiaceae bacterium]|nr:MBL fold metallo-hydrolase [Casimicrobiaceae bacterium]
MRIQFIGHAALHVVAQGISVLSDPWWRGPCFGAQWWLYPKAELQGLKDTRLDYVYISHGHHDHFHPGTLATLRRSFRCLVSTEGGLAIPLREAGYDVLEVSPDASVELGNGVSCVIWPTQNDDTLMALFDGAEVLVNANDALHAAPRSVQREYVKRLRNRFRKVDYFFCGYGTASHFPNCYSIPGKNRIESARQRQKWFTEQWAGIVNDLAPRYAFPFAADVVLLESDLFWANEAIHNAERPPAAFRRLYPHGDVQALDIAPGFVIANGRIERDLRRAELSADSLNADMKDEIARANTYGSVDEAVVDEIVELMNSNLATHAPAMLRSPVDFRFLIRFRGLKSGIEVAKRGSRIDITKVESTEGVSFDVQMLTRAHYLRASLTTPYGNEILFVGSGVQFEYARADQVPLNLHRYLMPLVRGTEPSQRPDVKETLFYKCKRLIKRMLGPKERDLYDLKAWTVFDSPREVVERREAATRTLPSGH